MMTTLTSLSMMFGDWFLHPLFQRKHRWTTRNIINLKSYLNKIAKKIGKINEAKEVYRVIYIFYVHEMNKSGGMHVLENS